MFLENMLKVKYTIYKVKYTIGTNIALRQKQTHQKKKTQNRIGNLKINPPGCSHMIFLADAPKRCTGEKIVFNK